MVGAIQRAMARELAELQLELKKRQWLAALRWNRRMKTCLASSGVTFTEWLVLDATRSLVDQSGDAVTQNDVARELDLDAMTIWHAMAVLDHRGLVRHARSLSGKGWRVLLTKQGADLLSAVQPRLQSASAATH